MTDFFSGLRSKLSGEEFEEQPVKLEEFIFSPDFLGMEKASDLQLELISAMTQIYKKSTLEYLWGEEYAEYRFKQTCNEVLAVLGKGCHAPYTPVFNPETGNWARLDSAVSDGLVISSDGNSHYATEAFIEGYGEMVRVRTSLGFEEDVYVGHKYLAYEKKKFYRRARGHKPGFKSISELNVGDRVGVSVGFDVVAPVNIPLGHAELIGYWLGDGMMPADQNPIINMDFCSDEVESIARYEELCAYIGDSPTKKVHPEKNLTFFRHGRNSKAVALAREYGLWGMRSHTKKIPDVLWASDNERIAAAVSKLWQTDGCVYAKNGLTAEYVSVSRQLATDVQRMLLRLGVASTIRFRTPKSNFKNASEAGCVTVASDECIKAFFNAVTLLDHKDRQPPVKEGRTYKRTIDGVYFDRIVSIEPIGEGEYWTRTVPDTGNYLGNGMISANSGKNYTTTISVAYIVYQLMCLKDPARYYGKPSGDNIDILNIAINAEQANRVFFKNFVERIKHCPWFDGKYDAKSGEIIFEKNINVYSGHSEREAMEGYNVFFCVLDEIDGFAMTSTSGNLKSKTAPEIYQMYRASVTSRYPDYGKLCLLSFPRSDTGMILTRYNKVIAEKETIQRSETLLIDPDGPETDDNKLTIEWDEDHITRYVRPKVFAMRRPSWEVNPERKIQDYVIDFLENYGDSLARYCCMPNSLSDGFFKRHESIDNAFIGMNGVDQYGEFHPSFKPKEGIKYYMHVDLAQKHDRAVVALAHVDRWIRFPTMAGHEETLPHVTVDALRWWTPSKDNEIDFQWIIDYIVAVVSRGFDVELVTFDRWNCLPENAMLTTSSGPVRIKDINEGDYIYTRHGLSKVGAKLNSGVQEVFRLTTRLGHEAEATANHRMLTRRGWLPVADIKVGDEILMNNKFSEFDGVETMTEDQAYALGALIADGWVADKKDHRVNFTTCDEEFFERFHRSMVKGWGFKNKVQKALNKRSPGSKVDTFSYHYWDKEMICKMRKAGLHRLKSGGKVVPEDVMRGSKEVRAAFLAGYVDGDGGIQSYMDKSGMQRYRLTVDSISEELIRDLIWLSSSLGLEPTRLRQRRKSRGRGVCIHRLSFEGKKAERFLAIIKPEISRKSSVNIVESSRRRERWTYEDNQVWLKVVKIESVGMKQTYDISIPEYEEFIADGFVTHNSHDVMKNLDRRGIKSENLSLKLQHYVDLKSVMYGGRLTGPDEELVRSELKDLIEHKGKVDHKRSKHNDLSEGICGAVYNAISRTNPDSQREVDVWTLADLKKKIGAKNDDERQKELKRQNVIQAPPVNMPADIAAYLKLI